MYKKRILSLSLAIIAAASAVLFSGCSGNQASNGTQAPAQAQTETKADTDADQGDAAAGPDSDSSGGEIDYGSLELTMGSTGAADDISTQAMTYMKDYIEEKSGGAIKVNTFPSSQLGATVDQLEMTGQGSIDLFLEANYMTSNGVNEAKVGSLTFTYGSKEDYRKVNESELTQQWKDKFCELNNIKIIANNWYRNGTALVSNREIHTVEDMKGLKVRIPPVDITMECFSELGMNPTPIAYNESLLALQQGIVDAIWCTEDAAYTMGFYEVAKYLIELNSYFDAMYVYMNYDLYQDITDVQRELIEEAALKAGEYYSGLADDILAENVAKMQEAGIQVISLPPEEVDKLKAPMKEIADRHEAAGEWPVGTYDEILTILGE
ncbi:MAG: TRAP transporter substrate-binding protein [Lachnospiraceae bacterium]|nr:TRAP transporter substrate-binding protein [Lachnospiraceae bacterium]